MRHWGTAEGLPSLSVTALAKDAEGFLWIGTTNGLFRFDGRLFEDFPFHGSESYALPSRHVTALCMHRNLLLVGTKGGACSIDAHSRIKAINLPGAAERGASPCAPGGGARPSRFTEDGALGLAAAVCWLAGSP